MQNYGLVYTMIWYVKNHTHKIKLSGLYGMPSAEGLSIYKENSEKHKGKILKLNTSIFSHKTDTFIISSLTICIPQRFFWHTYRHKWTVSCHSRLCVFCVINGIYDINDTLAFGIDQYSISRFFFVFLEVSLYNWEPISVGHSR